MNQDEELGRKLVKGSAWMIAMRWSARLMGLISMAVVARLLTPADFGIYAIAITFIGLLDALSDFGTEAAIIRHRQPEQPHYDTAWTVSVLGHLVIAILIAAFAPLAVHLYDDPRLLPVMLVMAMSALIAGFTNIGVADFRKNLDFGLDFKLNVLVQLCGVAATIGFAFVLRDYWALVLGGLARTIARVFFGYRMHAYRPRLSLAARSELLAYSLWTMVRSGANFISSKGERLIIGAYFGPALTGIYSIASDFATMIVFELLQPIGRALFPGMAIKQEDKDWDKRNLPIIFSITATLSIAMGFGLSGIATPAMELIFGRQYSEGGTYLAIFSVQMAILGLLQPVSWYLTVHANTEYSILLLIQGVCILATTTVLAFLGMPIEVIIYTNLAVNLLAFSQLLFMLKLLKGALSLADVARTWYRPFISGSLMLLVIDQLTFAIQGNPFLSVLLGALSGSLSFLIFLFGLWFLAQRPDGFEYRLLTLLKSRLGMTN